MTTTRVQSLGCAVCGNRSVHTLMSSSGAFGSYDLDLRPPPLLRYTMNLWLQECPTCRYVNDRIDKGLPGASTIVFSPEYAAIAARQEEPELVRRFKRYALLMAEHPIVAARALLHAAWVCDDAAHLPLAQACRDESADLLIGVDFAPLAEDGLRLQTVLVDILRRAGRFEEADHWLDQLVDRTTLPPAMAAVLRYQRTLLKKEDIGRYEVESAVSNTC
jgi:hypothetical protein